MRLQEGHELQVVLQDDSESGNEISIFKTVVEKIYKESKKPGLKRLFDKDECNLINSLNEYFNPKQPG